MDVLHIDKNAFAKLAEQDWSNKVDTTASSIAILTGDVTVDGSVKDVIFDSVLGSIVNTITLEDATEQSLIKKFTIDGVPYVYTSNSSVDMKHNGNALNVVLDGLRADVDSNANSTLELQTTVATISSKVDEHTVSIATLSSSVETNKNDISNIKEDIKDIEGDVEQLESEINNTINSLLAPMQATIATLQGEIATLRAELSAAQAKITTLETNAITTIQGTSNEIAVDRIGNTATIKFAEDAYFVAGV